MKNTKYLSTKEKRHELLKIYKKQVFKLYKDGNTLGRLCRETSLDVSSILFILKKCKITKKLLYLVFENQLDKTDADNIELFLENEKFHLEKFFPSTMSSYFSSSYVYYWKEKYKSLQDTREKCNHKTKHIACACCGKILADASNIEV